MSGASNELGPMPSYEEILRHVARARAMRAQYVADGLRRLVRLIGGRSSKAPAAPHGARTA